MHLGVFQRHGHVAGKLVEETNIVAGEFSALRVEQLQYANDFTGMVLDGNTQQRFGAIVQPLVKARIKTFQGVGILCIDDFAGDSNLACNALAKGNAYFLVVKPGGGNRPELFAFAIGEKDGAAFSFHFSARDFQDQLQEFRQIERGVEHARGFKEQGKLVDALVFFLRGQNVVEFGGAHFRIKTPPHEQVFRDFTGGVDGQNAGELSGREQRISRDVNEAGFAGKFLVVSAKGGEHNVFDGGLVVGDLAHRAGSGCR